MKVRTSTADQARVVVVGVNSPATSATLTQDFYPVSSDRTAKIKAAWFIPNAALAFNAGTYVTIELVSSTGLVCASASTAAASLVSGVAFPLTLSATAANVWQAGGGTIRWSHVCTGGSPAVPSGFFGAEIELL